MISNWACQLRHVSVYFTERKIMRLREPMELNAGIKIYQRIELEKWMEKM